MENYLHLNKYIYIYNQFFNLTNLTITFFLKKKYVKKYIFNFLFDKFKHYIYCVRGTLLCLGLVSGVHYCLGLVSVQTFFILLKLFSFTVYFPSLKFSRCLPQKITSSSTIVWGHTIASSCFPEVMILIFFNHFLYLFLC